MNKILSDEEIGHWVLLSRNGYKYIRIQCPICKIWTDGPVLIEEDGVHLFETWPVDETHEILEIIKAWRRRLTKLVEIPIEKLHIHVQIVDLHLDPSCSKHGFIQHFRNGKDIKDPRDLMECRFDAVLIHFFPGFENIEKYEEIILHELVHVAFPNAGRSRSVPLPSSLEEIFSDQASERWIENKTDELLKKYGYASNELYKDT